MKRVYQEVEQLGEMPTLADNPEDPEGQLAKWLDWYIRRQLSPKSEILARFIRREIADPTPMLQEIVDQTVTPVYEAMSTLVAAILPPGTPTDLIRVHCGQVNSPTVVKMLCKPISDRMPMVPVSELDVDSLVLHTQQCVMAGLQASGGKVSERWLVHS